MVVNQLITIKKVTIMDPKIYTQKEMSEAILKAYDRGWGEGYESAANHYEYEGD